MSEPHDDGGLQAALRAHFGFEGFREGQRQVIASVLAGRPTLAVMPTGAGKSLCFQLPALLLPGVTLVVSPLISLMKDQVDALQARGISATFVNSLLGEAERAARVEAMARGDYRLVYVAPERFRSTRFLELLGRMPLALFAVDEAHCISLWGHDFRPDFARLGEVRQMLRPPRTLALTATATASVRADIVRALRLERPAIYVAGFDRPNLFLEVTPVRTEEDKLKALEVVLAGEGSGIVYTATRKRAERLARRLGGRGREAVCYHGGLDDAERERAHDLFRSDRSCVVVATNAFGMGVDKPDIRFVVHFEMPRSLEAYYQEIGRAGRDGAPAHAALLFNPADVVIQDRLIEYAHPPELVVRDLWEYLRRQPIVQESQEAIGRAIGAAPAQVFSAMRLLEQAGHLERGGPGDAPALIHLLEPAAQVTLPPRATAQRAALAAIEALVGHGASREVFLDGLAERAGLSLEALRRALQALAAAGVVQFRPAFPGRVIRVLSPSLPSHALRVDMRMVRWRERRERALLKEMAAYAWTRGCRRRFLIGHFGEQAPFRCRACDVCAGRRLPANPGRARRGRRSVPPDSGTREKTLELYRRGMPVAAIARERSLSADTIRGHLAELVARGHRLDLRNAIEPDRLELILEVAQISVPSVQALKRALPPDFMYSEIALVLAARRAGLIPPGR